MPNKSEENSLIRAQDHFILEWERLSSSWGVNRTMAQIHALLFVTSRPMEVNEIMSRLGISRGNASMNLRELLDWGIVRRHRKIGDRKDTYVAEGDPWQMFMRVVRERKRREIDPTADALRECLNMLVSSGESGEEMRRRLQGLMEIFELIDAAYRQAFSTDEAVDELKRTLQIP